MASRAQTAPFMDQLLASLPENAEPVASKAFMGELRRDREQRWELADVKLRLAKSRSGTSWCIWCIAKMEGATEEEVASAYQDYCAAERVRMAAIGDLMMTPVAKLGHLRWKEDLRKADGGRDEWEAQIVADAEWLAGRA